MSRTERLLILLAALVLGLSFILPIWQIDIWAPQYPEGLGMTIWLSRLTGSLDQINILNHYIGMKHITPAAIPELRVLPVVMLVLVGIGILTAIINRRWGVAVWVIALTGSGLVGLYDFYRWGYDYGHNLNPDAPIKISGMSYQPPLIGHKQLLNIDACSYPASGGVALGLAVGLALIVLFWNQLTKTRWAQKLRPFGKAAGVALAIALPWLAGSGCTVKPEPIETGTDHCKTCLMSISNNRFGGEIITKKGKLYKFDSLDCLISFYLTNSSEVKSVLVEDFLKGGTLIAASDAKFLRSEAIHAPMGHGVVASRDLAGLNALKDKNAGEVLEWKDLLRSVPSS